MRVFKNKWFARWARAEGVTDSVLLKAAAEIAEGQVEVDLGGCLFKKSTKREREAWRLSCHSGIQSPNSERIIFLYAFAKNSRANISDKEKEALSLVANAFVSTTDVEINLFRDRLCCGGTS